MYAIQENEVSQLRDLTALLALETNFVEQYLEVLRDVKAGWVDECVPWSRLRPRLKLTLNC